MDDNSVDRGRKVTCLSIVHCPQCKSPCLKGEAYVSLIQERIGVQGLSQILERIKRGKKYGLKIENLCRIEQSLLSGRKETEIARELGITRQAVSLSVHAHLPHLLRVFRAYAQMVDKPKEPKLPYQHICKECGKEFTHKDKRTLYCESCKEPVRRRQRYDWAKKYRTRPEVKERIKRYHTWWYALPDVKARERERDRARRQGITLPRTYTKRNYQEA